MEDYTKVLAEITELTELIRTKDEPLDLAIEDLDKEERISLKKLEAEQAAELESLIVRHKTAKDAVLESFSARRDSLMKLRDEAVGSDKKRLRDLQAAVLAIPIEEAIALMPADLRPEAITVREQGDRIVLVRSPLAPEYAFMVFAERTTSTQWQMELKNSPANRRFSVCCACCPIEGAGLPPPEGDDKVKQLWWAEKKERLIASLLRVCQTHGVSTVFMRKASRWSDVEGVEIVEADAYRIRTAESLGKERAENAMAFVADL